MTRDEARKRAQIMLAYADGAEVQGRGSCGNWLDLPSPDFYADIEYRIKPKLREFWINEYPGRSFEGYALHPTREAADRNAASDRIQRVHFVEQPED